VIDPTVRRAVGDDLAQLMFLEDEARSALLDQRGGPRWLETHAVRGEGWSAVLERSRVWVAVLDDVLMGYIVLSTDRSVATIDEVYVSPDAREVGFGDALLESAIESARAGGARLLEGEALPGDRDTKNLYERAGIKARLITVSTEL
jgi:GNAT superfamily N-acetyltransferase